MRFAIYKYKSGFFMGKRLEKGNDRENSWVHYNGSEGKGESHTLGFSS